MSTGPYKLNPGDSINVSFAVIGGTSEQNLKSNADHAQNFYNTNLVNTNETEFSSKGYKVYPNPAGSFVNISIENDSGCEVELKDVMGKTIKNIHSGAYESEITINIGGILPGIYFILIKNEERTSVYKVVLE